MCVVSLEGPILGLILWSNLIMYAPLLSPICPVLSYMTFIVIHGPSDLIWSNFMRMHIEKKLCHFFMVNQSLLLTLIFIEIAWGFFLLSKFKLLVDNWIKYRPKGGPKSQNNFLLLAIIHEEKKLKF